TASIGCSRIVLPMGLKVQRFSTRCEFSQIYPASVSNTWPPHFGHSPTTVLPVKSIFGGGSEDLVRPLPSRGGKSNAVLPSFTMRNALNGRLFFLEMNFVNRSVLPSASSFLICSGGISCCKMILPERKSHVGEGPVCFSQT